jgi:hypothetical protein
MLDVLGSGGAALFVTRKLRRISRLLFPKHIRHFDVDDPLQLEREGTGPEWGRRSKFNGGATRWHTVPSGAIVKPQ